MKLRSLRVHGFKSFADATEIDFHDGITAIVGPNGCGKSNISDAVRWVLGEQRPTAIRGARMEEAIFQGSVSRRPVNRGSVTMIVGNEDGALPVPFEEVEIGRTVYRDGGSEYSLNRSPCRLRDVIDLCRDTGLGANAYAVIEGRMIDAILSDRAEERRALFEEAAGIGRYKDRRRNALRRLERAELDLQRLDDVIAEVETKVRSLARQKGRAERYHSLRERRLDVEMAVVRHQLDELSTRLARAVAELTADDQTTASLRAELGTAEADYEGLRIQQVAAERSRSEAAGALDEIRGRLARWERDLAVAAERAGHGEGRLARIAEERDGASERAEALHGEAEGLDASRAELESALAVVRAEMEDGEARGGRVRDRLQQARADLEGVEAQERELARRGAQLEGDAEAADAQAAELGRRLERVSGELQEAASELSELDSQGDLFADRIETLAREVEAARTAVSRAEGLLEGARRRLEEARAREVERQDRAGALDARRSALEALDRDRQGVEPAVRAVLERGDPAVHGTLADFVAVPAELVRAVEAYLGPLARGLVVRDTDTAVRLARWFREEWTGGGGLLVLALDRVPSKSGAGGSLLRRVEAVGEGAPWVRALLAGTDLVDDEGLLDGGSRTRDRVSGSGATLERRGVLRVGHPEGSGGILERRQQLRDLERDATEARSAAAEARAQRDRSLEAVRSAEAELEGARATLRAAEDAHHRAGAEGAARDDRRTRMDRLREELHRQMEGTRAARERALERTRQARKERKALLAEEEAVRKRRAAARGALDGAQEAWEEIREEESRLAVRLARLEAEATRLTERRDEAARGVVAARERIARLDLEEKDLRDELAEVARLREEGAEATESLFRARDEAEAELRERDQALARVAEALETAEKRVRAARTAERDATERRHRLELERQEIEGRVGRIQERVEGEWGRPLEELLADAAPVEGDPEGLRAELHEIVAAVERIGPVNMLAVEEHEEESARLRFLTEQRDDLVRARDDLRAAIRQINETATGLFRETFESIRKNFRETFRRLFQGGECDLWLEESDDPLEGVIEIHASPRGKKTQRIDLLSGGERALTALSLLFGIYLVKPSPFCVLDEVDAPLDEANIGRFIRLLQEFKRQTQFVVITHNPRTIEAADWIYGVTMEEPGVSTIVGVRLQDALRESGSAA